MRQLLTERYRGRLAGVLSCYDRIIVTGTLPGACYAKGMTGFLSARQIRIFDYARFAEPLRDRVRERATELANTSGVIIEHIAKNHLRKADKIACSRGFVYMVNSWLMRDSLHWGLGRIAPRCLGSPPSPSDERWPTVGHHHGKCSGSMLA